jgi:hypothetical protein
MRHGIAHPRECDMTGYDTDFVLWSREQADLPRRMSAGERVNDLVDWENVAEEIDSLGRSDWRELRRRVQVTLRHLIQLLASAAVPPRQGWRRTVVEQRAQIRVLLEDSPSSARRVPEAISSEFPLALTLALSDLAEFGEQPVADPATLTFTDAQVLGPGCPTDRYPDSDPTSTRTPGPIVELSDTLCT